jgi:TonB family protein
MMIEHLSSAMESTRRNEALCMTFATGLHLLALIWNPILLRSNWQKPHDFVEVSVVEQPAPGSVPVPPAPRKMSLMETLKNMLSRPAEEIAHIAPSLPVVQRPAAPAVPLLKDLSRPRSLIPAFNPKSQEDLAALNAPTPIRTGEHLVSLQPSAPSLHAKAFGGIRAKDLPFAVSGGQETLGTAQVSAIPVAIGNSSAKSALGYQAPTLKDASGTHFGILPPSGRGLAGDVNALASAGPAPISLSGTGGTGAAPTGPSGGASLTQRGGGGGAGLFNRGFGGGYGTGFGGTGVEGIPSAAQQLEQQIEQASSSGAGGARKMRKSFDLAGPLTNRPIIRKVIPEYPTWAEEQGIIGSVRLYFTVTPDGKVRSTIRVTKTTGYPQLDQLGIDAIKQWQFAPLSSDEEGKGEWGIITFNFSLTS